MQINLLYKLKQFVKDGGIFMKFTKMHGIGNDYIFINCFKEKVNNPSELAVKMSNRHFGVGSDGLVLIMPSEAADFKMRIFNPDGSEAEMCGNAIRCVGKYVYDNKMTNKNIIKIETLAGVKVLHISTKDNKVLNVRVDMGEPILNAKDIPVITQKERFVLEEIDVDDKKYKVTCVSMGNPHAVLYVDDVKSIDIKSIGPKIENYKLFPHRINVEFVKIIDKNNLEMRVWERGAGETLACGTGACAVLVASVINEFCNRKANIKLPGGELIIEWDELDNHVYMTGPATKVFEGVWE